MYNKNTLTAQNYLYGVENEKKILGYLETKGLYIQPSSKEEDRLEDIDCYINRKPVSIKTQHTCLKTGNLCFELEVKNRFTGEWTASWFRTGKAVIYVINVGDVLFSIKKIDLLQYEIDYGFDSIKKLSFKTKLGQGNHIHADAKVGLINLVKLKEMGYVRPLGKL